ncbi:MAG: glycoside hydrolase family 97 N-terminal domain-containing protein, partial [Bacteroidaceae bacterium]|nr:glycoside hydrolase family 97 N-terminal domain-containing protein [Bacteroidaceae bacterium]
MLLFLPSITQAKKISSLSSPDKGLYVLVDLTDGRLSINISSGRETPVFENVPLGIKTSQRDFTQGLELVKEGNRYSMTEDYTMLTGKRKQCYNVGNIRPLTLRNAKGEEFEVELRAYNDGVAFRYKLDNAQKGETLSDELTSYHMKKGVRRWMQAYHPDSYEDFYPETTDATSIPKANIKWGYPALVEPIKDFYALITEANIRRDNCGSILTNSTEKPDDYKVTPGDDKAPLKDNWVSPWRVIILGSLSTIVESTLVTDVSDPCTTTDTDWIKPGIASWIYWAYNHGSQDYQIINRYTDLAVDMQWPYTLIDAEWDVMKNGGTIEDAVNYATSKGIKPMIWYNSDANWTGPTAPTPQGRINTPEKREKEFSWLNKIGVTGVKIDFFKNDNTWSMNNYLDLIEATGRHHLNVVFHGCTVPRGWQRTYPHLMTYEAVYGAEWYNNKPVLT